MSTQRFCENTRRECPKCGRQVGKGALPRHLVNACGEVKRRETGFMEAVRKAAADYLEEHNAKKVESQ